MRIAKATKEDILAIMEFFLQWEMLESQNWEIAPDDFDDETIEKMRPYLAESHQDLWDDTDTDSVKKAFFGDWFEKINGWRRVVLACDTLIDNACDPDQDVLDFRPDIKEGLMLLESKRTTPTT